MKIALGTFLLVASATLVTAQSLSVTYPVTGNAVKENEPLTITWNSSGIPAGDTIRVEIWRNISFGADKKLQTTTSTNDGSQGYVLCEHGVGNNYYVYLTHEASGTTSQGSDFTLSDGPWESSVSASPMTLTFEDTTSVQVQLTSTFGSDHAWTMSLYSTYSEPVTLNRQQTSVTFPTLWTFDSSSWVGTGILGLRSFIFRFEDPVCGREIDTNTFTVTAADDPTTVCGDGVKDDDEGCDEGGANSDTTPNACRLNCVQAGCGDGVIDSGEECDDGVSNSNFAADACRGDCKRATCGDDIVDTGEACDGTSCEPDCSGVLVIAGSDYDWNGDYHVESGCPSSCCCFEGAVTVTQSEYQVAVFGPGNSGCVGLAEGRGEFYLGSATSFEAEGNFEEQSFTLTKNGDEITMVQNDRSECTSTLVRCDGCTAPFSAVVTFIVLTTAGGVAVVMLGVGIFMIGRRSGGKTSKVPMVSSSGDPSSMMSSSSSYAPDESSRRTRGSTTSRTSSRGGRGSSTHRRSGSKSRPKRGSNASRARSSKRRTGSSSVQVDVGASEYLPRAPGSSSMPSRM